MGPGVVVVLAVPRGVDVFADPVGVDQPGGDPGGLGHRGEGDRRAGGFQGLQRGQGALTLVLAVFGPGRFQCCGTGLVGCGGAHPVCLAVVTMSGRRRAARARRRILLDSSTSARCSGSSSARRRRMVSTTPVNASISVLMLVIT